MARVAVIGAGIAGLTIARALQPRAHVVVFEKARGVGGRMSTRYADPFYFDHGAQFFTARSEAFKTFLAPLIAAGIVCEWKPKLVGLRPGAMPYDRFWFEPHYVARPHMNSLCKHLADGIDLRLSTEIAPLTREGETWALTTAQGEALGQFDQVISTAPPAQTQRLFGAHLPTHTVFPEMQGCHALMLGLAAPWPHRWHAATVEDSPIGWIALNSSKPGRKTNAPSLVVHATADWSDQHTDTDPASVEQMLRDELRNLIGALPETPYSTLHRWRYAFANAEETPGPYHLPALGLSAIGDWTGAARIEAAWQQAMALAALYENEPAC